MEKREKSFRILFLVFVFIIFFIFFLLQILAPLILPKASIKNLSGSSAISDNEFKINKMPFPYNGIYSIGDRLCHQRADRSFFLNQNQMPFCARCTAIWFGLVIGIFIMLFIKIRLNEKFFVLVIIGIIPLGIDGFGQIIGLWESTNLIRFLTGFLTGIISGMALGVIVDEFKDIIKSKEK